MGREYSVNEAGFKQKIQIKLDGVLIERGFRNKGEAVAYLKKNEDLTKEDINKRVRFVSN